MKECKYFQQLIVEDFYDEINSQEKSKLGNHLDSCEHCISYLSEIRSTLKGMNHYERPKPSEEFWDNYWINLESKLDTKASLKDKFINLISFIQFKPSWIYGLSTAAAFLIIGIFIGRSYFSIQPTNTYTTTEMSQKSIHTVATAERFIQRSKVLLLGIVNMDTEIKSDYKPNIQKQQQISKELIQQTAVLKGDLQEANQKMLLELVNELETILMQIANLEKEYDYDAIELIQNSLDRKGILVKINLGQILSESKKTNLRPAKKSKKQI